MAIEAKTGNKRSLDAALGQRLRELRRSAGLTQSELAQGRFSKEYISQIELGKTSPTPETVGWLSARLGVDPSFLTRGVRDEERDRAEAVIAHAARLMADSDFEAAAATLEAAREPIAASGAAEVQERAFSDEGWCRIKLGDVGAASELLERARMLASDSSVAELARAETAFRLGVSRYLAGRITDALALYAEALETLAATALPSDTLRASIHLWRSRCYRRLRDFEGAREEVERALELAAGITDERLSAEAYFQASVIAEREGRWVLARTYAERARGLYEELGDLRNTGRLLNNLGVFAFELGHREEAVARMRESLALSLEFGDDELATSLSSLAQVSLKTGDPVSAEQSARRALRLLEGRDARLDELGGTRLVLGRALLDQGRLEEAEAALASAEDALARLSSDSHSAAAWIARGDLARARGDFGAAADLYRRAAEILRDSSL